MPKAKLKTTWSVFFVVHDLEPARDAYFTYKYGVIFLDFDTENLRSWLYFFKQ